MSRRLNSAPRKLLTWLPLTVMATATATGCAPIARETTPASSASMAVSGAKVFGADGKNTAAQRSDKLAKTVAKPQAKTTARPLLSSPAQPEFRATDPVVLTSGMGNSKSANYAAADGEPLTVDLTLAQEDSTE